MFALVTTGAVASCGLMVDTEMLTNRPPESVV
jgi:hypothetical protein